MYQARQISMFAAILAWAILMGGIAYAHVVYLPPYLSNLPDSNQLITGKFAIREERFWMGLHPLIIIISILTLVLNWKVKARRKFFGIAFIIYALALVVTAIYFVPELKAFAAADPSVTASEWYGRGQTWEKLSWVRGGFLYGAFILALVALTKDPRR